MYVEAEEKHNIDFSRANDIDILDFLQVPLNTFHVFSEMNWEVLYKLELFFFFKHVILTCVDKFAPERSVKRKESSSWATR